MIVVVPKGGSTLHVATATNIDNDHFVAACGTTGVYRAQYEGTTVAEIERELPWPVCRRCLSTLP